MIVLPPNSDMDQDADVDMGVASFNDARNGSAGLVLA
jgi:hypothetical protein